MENEIVLMMTRESIIRKELAKLEQMIGKMIMENYILRKEKIYPSMTNPCFKAEARDER